MSPRSHLWSGAGLDALQWTRHVLDRQLPELDAGRHSLCQRLESGTSNQTRTESDYCVKTSKLPSEYVHLLSEVTFIFCWHHQPLLFTSRLHNIHNIHNKMSCELRNFNKSVHPKEEIFHHLLQTHKADDSYSIL